MQIQLSMFDEDPLTWLERALLHGSGFENSRIRIYAASVTLKSKDLPSFLKDEYGIGGHSFENGFVDYNTKGISLREWKSNIQEKYNWNQVAETVRKLIAADRYLNSSEKSRLNTVQKHHHGRLPVPIPRMKYE